MTNYVDSDMEYREKIQKLFLGRPIAGIQFVVFTPIPSAFHRLFSLLHCETSSSDGFFLNAEFAVYSSKKGILICCPMGASAQDVMFLFSNVDYYFFGLAGGLKDSFSIGDIVTVNAIFTESGSMVNLCPINGVKSVKLAFSPCFLGPTAAAYQKKARLVGADVVDMESVFCVKAAGCCANRFSELLVISDLPGKREVWECAECDFSATQQGVDQALSELVRWVNYGK